MIWKDPVHKTRPVDLWLQDWTLQSGMPALVEKHRETQIEETFLMGMLLVVKGKGKEGRGAAREIVAKVLAGLSNHADTADSLGAFRALDSHKKNVHHNPSDLPFRYMVDTTDVLAIGEIEALDQGEIRELDRILSIRASEPPKVTILLGDLGTKFRLLCSSYGDRVRTIKGE